LSVEAEDQKYDMIDGAGDGDGREEMTYDLDPMNKRVLILRLPMNVWFLLKFV